MSNSLPADESPEETARASRVPKHWIVLGLLVAAHAAFGAYFTPIGRADTHESITSFMMIGVLVSQPILFAIWASFAHQRFYHRFLWSLLLCTLVSFTDELGTLRHSTRELGVLMLLDLALFAVATIILSFFRRFFRWQIMQPIEVDAPSAYQKYHFGIKHLLILTTLTALFCGLFRTLSIIAADQSLFPSIGKFIGFTCLFLALLFPVVVMPWYTLGYRKKLPSLIFMTLSIGAVLDLAAYYLTIVMQAPPHIVGECLLLQLGSALSACVSTLVIRWCGFRMVREPRAEMQTQV